jgi:short-subunit dehydrogenase
VRETVSKLLSLEEGGVEVLVLRTDVTKLDEMKRLIARAAKRFGAIHGIFHAAGVAHLEYLAELTDDISQLEFQPKIYGLLNLEEAIRELAETTGKKPEFVVLFSSLASILGGLGMAAYTAANRFMDAFAQTNTVRNGVSWICINWDDWDFKYTKEQTTAYKKTMAKFAIPPHEGLEALERILGHPGATQVLVSTRPIQPRMEQWLHQKDLFQAEDGVETHVPDGAHIPASGAEQATARGVERVAISTTQWDDLERQVAAVYEQVLGVANLLPDDNFFDLGGDSLLASQILLRLQRNIPEAKTTPLRCIFDCPTVRRLAAWMRENAPTS